MKIIETIANCLAALVIVTATFSLLWAIVEICFYLLAWLINCGHYSP